MQFKLNNVAINVGVMPAFVETLDEELDSGSVELEINDSPNAIAPMTPFQFIDDNSNIFNFVVIVDQVSIFSKSPLSYKHVLTIAQNTRKLSKQLIRRTVFSQPAQSTIQAQFSAIYQNDTSQTYLSTWNSNQNVVIPIEIGLKHKIKNAFITWDIFEFHKSGATQIMNKINKQFTLELYRNNALVNSQTVYVENYTYLVTNKIQVALSQEMLEALESNGVYTIKATNIANLGLVPEIVTVSVYLNINVYYYTLFDVIDILIKQQMLKTLDNTNTALCSLPTSGDFYTTLKNTIAPNFTFTSLDFYSCIAEVYKFIDAVPTLNVSNVLGVEYFNNNSNTNTFNPTANAIGESIAIGEETFANNLVAEYQQGRTAKPIWFPGERGYSKVRAKELGIVQANSYIFKLPQKIDSIIEVHCNVPTFNMKLGNGSTVNEAATILNSYFDVDISYYVVEKSVWLLLPKSTSELYGGSYITRTQFNTFWYEQNGDYIYVGALENTVNGSTYTFKRVFNASLHKLFGSDLDISLSAQNWSSVSLYNEEEYYPNSSVVGLTFKCKYKPILDGRLLIAGNENKYEGAILSNQSNGHIELEKLGLNMFGLVNKIGNEEITFTQRFSSFNARVRKGAIWTDNNGARWLADVVKTTIFNDHVICDIKFTKNFNKLSQFIKINQTRRFNEIDNTLVTTSEDNFIEYLYFTQDTLTSSFANRSVIAFNSDFLLGAFSYNFLFDSSVLQNIPCVDYVYLESWVENSSTSIQVANKINMPLVKYGAGNSLCFEMGFDSPISAGSRIETTSSTWFIPNYESNIVKYADSQGFADSFYIYFYQLPNLIDSETSFSEELPIISTDAISDSTQLGGIQQLKYYKKPNEIFKLNYQLMLLPYGTNKDIFFGENFVNNNSIIGENINLNCKIYYSTTEKYSILDKKALGTQLSYSGSIPFFEKTNIVLNTKSFLVSYKFKLGSVYPTFPVACVSWCIADENDNILISFNGAFTTSSNFKFSLFTSNKRL